MVMVATITFFYLCCNTQLRNIKPSKKGKFLKENLKSEVRKVVPTKI